MDESIGLSDEPLVLRLDYGFREPSGKFLETARSAMESRVRQAEERLSRFPDVQRKERLLADLRSAYSDFERTVEEAGKRREGHFSNAKRINDSVAECNRKMKMVEELMRRYEQTENAANAKRVLKEGGLS